jgi:hypothetical protein
MLAATYTHRKVVLVVVVVKPLVIVMVEEVEEVVGMEVRVRPFSFYQFPELF